MQKNILSSFVFILFIFFNLTGCSEEDKHPISAINNLNKAAKKVNKLEDSKFDKICINKINNVEATDYDKMSARGQAIMAGVFNECIGALNQELSLTEKEFKNPEKNKLCYEGVKEFRSNIPEIKSEIKKFTSLPNKTDEDSMNVSLLFAFLSSEIITKGSSAMLNRTLTCTKNSKQGI